ncbi:hypothetical protein IC006_0206 [Sulfuracidifex tepidarius]|uniref:Zinc-ribbon domain-containing protein n=2 Tax=Sulfuracidifex tepidarius TaxID=1294262 RepID=A0A510DRX3_9CREN|nr:hypothetical protein IC006_0206 [Sulfuracidifex tepidarius]
MNLKSKRIKLKLMVKICPRCGYPNDDSFSYCQRCGYNLKRRSLSENEKNLLRGFRSFSIINLVSLIYLSVTLGLAYLLDKGVFFNDFYSFLGFLGAVAVGTILLFISVMKLRKGYSSVMRDNLKYKIPYLGTTIFIISFLFIIVFSVFFLSTSVMGLFIPSSTIPFATLSVMGLFVIGSTLSLFLGIFRAYEEFNDKVFLLSSSGFIVSTVMSCVAPFYPILLIPLWLVYLISVTLLYAASDFNLSLNREN